MRLSKLIAPVVGGAIATHLIATTLFNTPDSFNLDLRRYVGGWTIPGWRFFAPNPGVQNVHLLIRSRADDGLDETPTAWTDVTPVISHRLWNVFFNPWSRGPKALFDAMQQLSVMKGNYSRFEWMTRSTPYEIVRDAARASLKPQTRSQFQFLLVNYFPSAPTDRRMDPVLVSKWESVDAACSK